MLPACNDYHRQRGQIRGLEPELTQHCTHEDDAHIEAGEATQQSADKIRE